MKFFNKKNLKLFIKKIDLFKSEAKTYTNGLTFIPSILGGIVSFFLILFTVMVMFK